MATWPYKLDMENAGNRVTFLHYALDASGQGFAPVVRRPGAVDLDSLFESLDAALVFYGHDHEARDVAGHKRYVNPGALGFSRDAVARYCAVDISRQGFTVEHRTAVYDSASLFRAFEERGVPERQFIQRVFFGRQA